MARKKATEKAPKAEAGEVPEGYVHMRSKNKRITSVSVNGNEYEVTDGEVLVLEDDAAEVACHGFETVIDEVEGEE